jgi:hypothetical protein
MTGLGMAIAILVISGTWSLPQLHGREFPALTGWVALGAVPVTGALLVGWLVHRNRRLAALAGLAAAALAFTGILAVAVSYSLDPYKAPRELVKRAGAQNTSQDVRIGCYQYFQPSLVFYCRREVEQLPDERQVEAFISSPLPSYLVLPAVAWERMQTKQPGSGTVLARQYDLYRHCEVVVVGNHHSNPAQACRGDSWHRPLVGDRP